MAEDEFVQMLLEAAVGNVEDQRDIELARAAGGWLRGRGWQPYPGQGFVYECAGAEYWIYASPELGALLITVRLDGRSGWHLHARWPIAHLGHGLNVLAAEELIPAHFCTLGREALESLATAHERTARVMAEIVDDAELDDLAGYALAVKAEAFEEAAESARRFAGVPLAVLS